MTNLETVKKNDQGLVVSEYYAEKHPASCEELVRIKGEWKMNDKPRNMILLVRKTCKRPTWNGSIMSTPTARS
jgi:hypothetical protein